MPRKVKKDRIFAYYVLLPNGRSAREIVSARLPTYPSSMRFESFDDMAYYYHAKRQFIQSTKIPDSCHICPVVDVCVCATYGKSNCRNTWRKIWEYHK